jgi:uncharacterized protein involved in exopolysaccharide biosynthesis
VPDGETVNQNATLMADGKSPRKDLVQVQPDGEIIPIVALDHEVIARSSAVLTQRLLWENRRLIIKTTVVGLLVSTLIAFLIPKRFQSTARLMPPDQGDSSLSMLAAASGGISASLGSSSLGEMAGDLLGLKSSSDLFIGVLQSRTVQDDLISMFNLRKIYWDRRIEDAREDLGKHTNLSEDHKSGIITIQVVDNSPALAAAMVGEYVTELNRVVTQLNTSSAHRERVFLEDRLNQVKSDLESAEVRFSEFASKNTALDIPTQGKTLIEATATLEGQLIAAQTELESLKQIYADGNVRVRATQARVDELRRQLNKNLGSNSGESGKSNGQDQASIYPSIRELPALGVGYADLYRNTKVQEAIFQTLTQEYEIAKVQEAKETPSVIVLDPPDVPEKKSFPPRLLLMILGTMLAMATAIVCVLGKQRWNDIEQGNPQKLLAQEVMQTVCVSLPWAGTNGGATEVAGTNGLSKSQRNGNQEESNAHNSVTD